VERINSAKSPIESRSTLASLACCGAPVRTFAPVFAVGRGIPRGAFSDVGEEWEVKAVNLEADELVRGLSPPFVYTRGGWALRGDSGDYKN
jgi:hypothetical protein